MPYISGQACPVAQGLRGDPCKLNLQPQGAHDTRPEGRRDAPASLRTVLCHEAADGSAAGAEGKDSCKSAAPSGLDRLPDESGSGRDGDDATTAAEAKTCRSDKRCCDDHHTDSVSGELTPCRTRGLDLGTLGTRQSWGGWESKPLSDAAVQPSVTHDCVTRAQAWSAWWHLGPDRRVLRIARAGCHRTAHNHKPQHTSSSNTLRSPETCAHNETIRKGALNTLQIRPNTCHCVRNADRGKIHRTRVQARHDLTKRNKDL